MAPGKHNGKDIWSKLIASIHCSYRYTLLSAIHCSLPFTVPRDRHSLSRNATIPVTIPVLSLNTHLLHLTTVIILPHPLHHNIILS